MPSSLILSFCYADIPYVLSVWQDLLPTDSNVKIICATKGLFNRLSLLLQSDFLDLDVNSVSVSSDPLLLVDSFSHVYLFTLGSRKIADLILKSQRLGKEVFYQDCYFSLDNYSLRLINPLRYLFSGRRSSICSTSLAFKQILRQLWYDPLRRSMIFSGDSHCWLRPDVVASLSSPNITPVKFSAKLFMPSKSLLFALNSTQNSLSIDWDFFRMLGYKLYYKPHPLPTSDYSFYPDFVKPYAEEIDPSQIYFGQDSFLVSCYSYSLASTPQSISLAKIFYDYIHPLLNLYCNLASYTPSDYHQLSSLLSGHH
jgi:hypothetical protein